MAALSCSLGLLTLAGCAAGPDYQRPAIDAPERYRHEAGWQTVAAARARVAPDGNETGNPIAAGSDPVPGAAGNAWWQPFDDRLLGALLDESAGANQTVAQAEARYRQAWARLRGARAQGAPTLGASLGATRSASSRAGSSGESERVGNGYETGVQLSWTLDLWGRIRRQVEADDASLQAGAADLAAARLSVQALLAQSYFQLRINDQQQVLIDQTLAAYARALQLTRNQYEAGLVARADVIQSQTQLESLRVEVYELAQTRAELENAMAVLLGRAPGGWQLQPSAALAETPSKEAGSDQARVAAAYPDLTLPRIPAELPSALLVRRPDVVAAERQVASANAAIGVARSAWLPELSLNASYGASASQWARLFDAPYRIWSLGPAWAATLFDGGRREAVSQEAQASYDEQVATYRQTVLTAWQEVDNALAAQQWLAARAEQQARLVALAQENERVVGNRYREGLVTYLELSTAQNLTFSSQRDALSTLGQQLEARVRLVVALGGGWTVAGLAQAP